MWKLIVTSCAMQLSVIWFCIAELCAMTCRPYEIVSYCVPRCIPAIATCKNIWTAGNKRLGFVKWLKLNSVRNRELHCCCGHFCESNTVRCGIYSQQFICQHRFLTITFHTYHRRNSFFNAGSCWIMLDGGNIFDTINFP